MGQGTTTRPDFKKKTEQKRAHHIMPPYEARIDQYTRLNNHLQLVEEGKKIAACIGVPTVAKTHLQ